MTDASQKDSLAQTLTAGLDRASKKATQSSASSDILPPDQMAIHRRLDKVRRRLLDDAEEADRLKRRLLKEAAEIAEEMKVLAA